MPNRRRQTSFVFPAFNFPRGDLEPPRHLPVPVLALEGAFFPLGVISRPPAGAHVRFRHSPVSGVQGLIGSPGGRLGPGRLRRFARAGCASFRYAPLRTARAPASRTARKRYRVSMTVTQKPANPTAKPPALLERLTAVQH